VTAKGVCWSLSPNPTTSGDHTTDGNENGSFISSLTSLILNTGYYVRAYATNSTGTAYGNELTFTITAVPLISCPGMATFTINHLISGGVAPVNKTVTYGTVTNIPGEPLKCWITSNLGADHQAGSVDDATEPSAGWYWQFNRKQGFKHDGTTRTPYITWISAINENLHWQSTNDPCTIEIGSNWHIPTFTEFENVNALGFWINWNGPWNSGLKLHAAGDLYFGDGSLLFRGANGHYWSNTQCDNTGGFFLSIYNSNSSINFTLTKTGGFSVRCVKNN
jgi:hypothetical protein